MPQINSLPEGVLHRVGYENLKQFVFSIPSMALIRFAPCAEHSFFTVHSASIGVNKQDLEYLAASCLFYKKSNFPRGMNSDEVTQKLLSYSKKSLLNFSELIQRLTSITKKRKLTDSVLVESFQMNELNLEQVHA